MANCPNCGSEYIQLTKDTNVDWGRAVVGWALFGVVGGAVGAVTGEDRNANACLDCGTSWKAADLYKTRQVIRKLTGVELDLAYEEDRDFINDFINDISIYIKAISEAEKKAKLIIKNSEDELASNMGMFNQDRFSTCCFYWIFWIFITICTFGLALLVFPFYFPYIKKNLQKNNNERIKRIKYSGKLKIKKAQREAEKIKIDAEDNLMRAIKKFMQSHPL